MNTKTAFLFPGQGSQSVGMVAEMAEAYPVVRQTFEEASGVLGYDLWEVVENDPAETLGRTEVTQPALLAAGIATWRAWKSLQGADPDFVAGHSLGEYTALVAADALAFGDAISLVAQRGRLMQQATPAGTGAMAAILGLEDAALAEVCEQAAQGQVVSCANFNSPGQVVIAGHTPAVERAIELAKANGARRALILPVSAPVHSSLMREAGESLLETLDREIRILGETINGDVLQAVAMALAARARMIHAPAAQTADLARDLLADALRGAAAAKADGGLTGHG